LYSQLFRYFAFAFGFLLCIILAADWVYSRYQQQQVPSVSALNIKTLLTQYCQDNPCETNAILPFSHVTLYPIETLAISQQASKELSEHGVLTVSSSTGNALLFLVTPTMVAEYTLTHQGMVESNPYLPNFVFYSLLALSVFLAFWPLFADMWRIKQGVSQFAESKDLAKLELVGSRFFAPVTDTLSWMLTKIAKLIALQQELSASMSHDIRTQLSRMKFTLASLNSENVAEIQQTLKQDINDIQALLEQHLDFATLDHQTPELHKTPVQINTYLGDYISQISGYCDKKLTTQFAQLPALELDMRLVPRVFKNLIDNATKHAENEIVLSTAVCDKWVSVTVEDDGQGVALGDFDQIFLPYTKGSGKNAGYGLGLAICKKIMLWHQGEISVEKSKRLGGACFKLTFKRAD
jgi:two-component system OmpR family sensor kinase